MNHMSRGSKNKCCRTGRRHECSEGRIVGMWEERSGAVGR